MDFKNFRVKIAYRICIIFINLFLACYAFFAIENNFVFSVLMITSILLSIELYSFTIQTNRKLTRFLNSIRYSDFITGFSADNKLGESFKELNQSFNSVLEAFRNARSEKEEHLQFLNIVVEHVNVGLISFDEEGNIGLINAAAKKLIDINVLQNIEELIEKNSKLYKTLFDLPAGKSSLYKTNEDVQLSVHATEVRLAGSLFKLVALQNIQPELQKKELEAWQNLTKILRHEIMNSITPISSLTSTLSEILTLDLLLKGNHFQLSKESAEDLKEGLHTIENRSQSLIQFINAYRDYTTIPLPNLVETPVKPMLNRISGLMKSEFSNNRIDVEIIVYPESISLFIDEDQISQVLINLIKNSIESVQGVNNPKISIIAETHEKQVIIKIKDNGTGIVREALDKIFIPFFSTKKEGSGIGLALSRQIMQLHHGTISVDSTPNVSTTFYLRF